MEEVEIQIGQRLFSCRSYYNTENDYGLEVYFKEGDSFIKDIFGIKIPDKEENDYDAKIKRMADLIKNEIDKNNITIKPLSFFEENSDYVELNRYNSKGELVQTLGCFDENIQNLYNSQFEDKTVYGEIYRYDLYKY